MSVFDRSELEFSSKVTQRPVFFFKGAVHVFFLAFVFLKSNQLGFNDVIFCF